MARFVVADTRARHWRVGVVLTNADLSKRLFRMPAERFAKRRPPARVPVIHVDDGVRFQTIKGIGAAMTDTSAYLIHDKLGPAARAGLLRSLFSRAGAGLNFLRVPMGASDFTASGTPYTYDDLPAGQTDPRLAHFSVAHDNAYIAPTLRQVLRINPATRIIAAPWSPPGWMKTNDTLDDRHLAGTLAPNSKQALARYFVAFINAYARLGIPISAVTPENEPRAAAGYPSMYFPASDEADWIVGYLLPALRAAKLPTKVYGADTSLGAASYAKQIADADADRGLAGIAQHCYHGTPDTLTALHAAHPHLDLIISECAVELVPYFAAETVIASMRNWASTVGLWNLALDPSDGPAQSPNGCRTCKGVVTIDPRTHKVTYGQSYYQLAQIGRFLAPGARRIASNHFVSYRASRAASKTYGATPGIDDVAIRNPDGSIALVVTNTSGKATRFAVDWKGRSFTYQLPAHAMATFSWNHP